MKYNDGNGRYSCKNHKLFKIIRGIRHRHRHRRGAAFWTAVGLVLGTYLNWLLVARRLRSCTSVAKDSSTLPDFFSNRFHDKHKLLMIFSGLFIVVLFTIYTVTALWYAASSFRACLCWMRAATCGR